MQYQADLLHCAVRQPKCLETTALGSAMLAGLAVGVWESLDELRTVWKLKMRMTRKRQQAAKQKR